MECRNIIYGAGWVMAVLMAPAAFLTAALVFRHIHSVRELQFYHGLPVSRTGLYLTGYLSGFCLIALPLALGLGAGMILLAAQGCAGAEPAMVRLLGASFAVLLMFYSMAVLACTLAGHTFGALLIYLGLHGAVYMIAVGVSYVGGLILPGIVPLQGPLQTAVDWLTPLYKTITALTVRSEMVPVGAVEGVSGPVATVRMANGTPVLVQSVNGTSMLYMPMGFRYPLALIVYAVCGALLAIVGWALYRARRAETAGDMVAFGPVRTACKVFGALVVCAAGTLLITRTGLFRDDIPFPAVVVTVLGFAAVGWLVAEGVVRKSLRVFDGKALKTGGILLLALLAVLAVGKADLFGRVRHQPMWEESASVAIQWNGGYQVEMSPEDGAYPHYAVLNNLEQTTNNILRDGGCDNLTIEYELRNGGTLRRTYYIKCDYDAVTGEAVENAITEAVRESLSIPDYCYQTYFPRDWGQLTADTLAYAQYDDFLWYGETEAGESHRMKGSLVMTAQEGVDMYEAICRDIQAGRVPPNGHATSGVIGQMEFDWYDESYDASRFSSYQQYQAMTGEHAAYIEVTEDMTETIACLERIVAEEENGT